MTTRRPAHWNANETLDRIIGRADVGNDPFQGVRMFGSMDDLDRELIDTWLSEIAEAEKNLRQLRYQLESLRDERKCFTCGGPVVGRSDRAYCSTACRVEQHRGTSPRMKAKQAAVGAKRAAENAERIASGRLYPWEVPGE